MKNNNPQPIITVGITCYNACDTIARAINSAKSQDRENIEIIIVDDYSQDDSVSVVEQLIQDIPYGRLIKHNRNQGPAAARQTIIDNATGEFIVFFDDDDQSLPERVQRQYQRIISYEQETCATLVACYASGKRLYPNGYEVILRAIGSRERIPIGSVVADYLLFYGKNSGVFYGTGTPTCALMARKSTVEIIGGFDPSFRRVEDVDFAVRLSLAGGHFIGCPEELFLQYATEAGDKSPEKNMQAEVRLAEKYKDYLISSKRYEYAKRWPIIRYNHFTNNHVKMFLALGALFIRAPFKTCSHFMQTGPKRLLHEMKMKGKR